MRLHQICLVLAMIRFNFGDKGTTQKPAQHEDVSANDIRYLLYNSSSPKYPTILNDCNANLLEHFDSVVFGIHGWKGNATNNSFYNSTKDALFASSNRTGVVHVDWGKSAEGDYFVAAKKARKVGALVGVFIANLVRKGKLCLEKILMMGFSLGGQAVGFAGKNFSSLVGKKLPRILALDPAGPGYETSPSNERIHPTDAKVVHVIHCDGEAAGLFTDTGTIDFYPNGGKSQPGCLYDDLKNVTTLHPPNCDHNRCWMMAVEAFRAKTAKFISRKCDSYDEYESSSASCSKETEEMFSLTTNKTGRFYAKTNDKSPFSKD